MNTKQAISTLQQLVSQKKAVQHLDELLETLDTAESQYKEITGKTEKAKSENASAEKELTTTKAKIKEAEEKALSIISAAEAKAASILGAVDDAVNDAQSKANKKLKETEGRIASKEAIEIEANKKAQIALDKLNEINAELDKATARFKALVA